MKFIRALPKRLFDEWCVSIIEQTTDSCFISILDVDNEFTDYKITTDNFLQVRMWDIEKDSFVNGKLKREKPSDKELQKIVHFINKHRDKENFYIHCSAGISRSGAIAAFLFDKFRDLVDKEEFLRVNPNIQPNLYVLNKLKQLDSSND